MAASPVPSGHVFRPKGQHLIEHFLVPKALGRYVIPGLVAEGVDVFSASPDELNFRRNHRRSHGEVWGYFFGSRTAVERAPVPARGGSWFLYGSEKAYSGGNGVGEAVGFRRRFRYHVMRPGGGDGSGVWASTRWLMTEFRLNKGAAAFRCARQGPKVNLDCVVRKVFTKPAVPPPPPARSSDDESTGCFEGGMAFQQGGSRLPPRSARPPRPPKVVATPVAPPPHSQVMTTRMAPPPPAQVIAKPVAPPPPACSSKDEATSSRAQPDSPSSNRELGVRRVPAILPTSRAHFAEARRRWMLNKVPCGPMIITQYLAPKAILGHLRSVTPVVAVAEEVDVFAVSPDTSPFPPSHREQNGEVWGYFFAAKPTTSMHLGHGGCWMQYGGEKKYGIKSGEVVAFHRRFAFHAARMDKDGMVVWMQTRWLMKEYRMNKAAPSVRSLHKAKKGPGANTDLVVLKVFTGRMVPPPPSALPPPAPARFTYHSVNQGAGRSVAGGPSGTAAATCLSP